jgi:hypothetical protein
MAEQAIKLHSQQRQQMSVEETGLQGVLTVDRGAWSEVMNG